MDKKYRKPTKGVYAIVRIDHFIDEIKSKFAIKKIVRTQERAISEVDRLNLLNADKDCEYFWQYTRLEEEDKAQPDMKETDGE